MDVKLGDVVTDRITGFRGIVTGIVDYITGCRQALVAPSVEDKNWRDGGGLWFDVPRLAIIEHRTDLLDPEAGQMPMPGPDQRPPRLI